jgi:5'(3')-deoxyribonucleotidase
MIVYVDMDGVIVDLLTPWLAQYNEDFRDSVKPEDIKEWDTSKFVKCGKLIFNYLDHEGIWFNAPPYPGAIEMLKKWHDQGHELYLATTPWHSKYCLIEKVLWVNKHLPFLGCERLIFTHNKGLLRGDILIDDKPENLTGFRGARVLHEKSWSVARKLGKTISPNERLFIAPTLESIDTIFFGNKVEQVV